MRLRKLFLRIMLWSLAAAATGGVLAVLFGGGDLIWRVIGTGTVLAVASGLMLPASGMVDREQTRSAGLVGMAAVIVEFLLSLIVIWDIPLLLVGRGYEEPLLLTLLHFGLGAVVVVFFLRLRHARQAATAWLPGVLLTVATFCLAMIADWMQEPWEVRTNWWGTTGALAATGALTVACLITLPPTDWRNWRWGGVLASIVACVLWTGEVWIGSGSDIGLVIFCGALSLAAILAYTNLALLCPLKEGQTWLRTGTIGALAVAAVLIDLFVINEEVFHSMFLDGSLLARGAGAASIVSACGTLALLVLARLNRNIDYESFSTAPVQITVICPRCRKKHTLPLGQTACPTCELRIHTRIEEPRCPNCGYLLYGLKSDRCPECGTQVR
jgi:hypothetical protein